MQERRHSSLWKADRLHFRPGLLRIAREGRGHAGRDALGIVADATDGLVLKTLARIAQDLDRATGVAGCAVQAGLPPLSSSNGAEPVKRPSMRTAPSNVSFPSNADPGPRMVVISC